MEAIKLEQFEKLQWSAFASKFSLDPELGYLIHPKTEIKSFNIEVVENFLILISNNWPTLKLIDLIEHFPDIGLKEGRSASEMLILHDYLIAIVNVYIVNQRKNLKADKSIIIPKNLAVPLYESSNFLGLKIGMNSSLAFMWRPTKESFWKFDEDFGFGDFELKFYFTPNHYQETLFFGGSVIASYYLAKINKIIFEINSFITKKQKKTQEIIHKLMKCAQYWRKITKQNQKIIEQFESHYFYYELRPMLTGFTDITFQGVDHGADLSLSSTGGTAGCDPSFQIFEKGFGLRFEGFFQKMQEDLRTGMTNDHKKLIAFYQGNSNIREYCAESSELAQSYNKVLGEYSLFLMIHSKFVSKYILANIHSGNPEAQASKKNAKGTAGTNLMSLLERYKQIENQFLPIK